MKNRSLNISNIVRGVLFALFVLLTALLFIFAAVCHTSVFKGRSDGKYFIVQNVNRKCLEKEDAPIGLVNEFSFSVNSIRQGDSLSFYINHNLVKVSLDSRCVYSHKTTDSEIKTCGGTWVHIPLSDSDNGKEFIVELYPVYSNYTDEVPEFLIGAESAVYSTVFSEALPELLLSLCVSLAGVFLLSIAVYYGTKGDFMLRLFALGCLSLFTGIWRFTYGRFAYLILGHYSVFVYTLSIVSLMVIALAMLNCIEISENKRREKRARRICSGAYCLVFICQIALQLLGILDLRETLTLTHITLVISAVLLFISGLYSFIKGTPVSGRVLGRNYSWLLGIGVLCDLLLYYFAESSAGMLFTLVAILISSILEGTRLVVTFGEQKNALKEMETRLTLSRTATMMSQIRSHFVFNILNAISGMCKYDPEMADETVVRFARYLRNNIDIMENDRSIPFTQDLRQLEDYVALEQIRFGERLSFETDIETVSFMIPPLVLQPIVENAIKHGVSKKPDGGKIVLKTREVGDKAIITVTDNGIGFDMQELDKEKSVGLRNIRFRLEHLAGGTLDITSEKGVGTEVTVTLPREKNNENNLH